MKVLFVSTLLSPFQVEVSRAINARSIDYRVVFSEGFRANRGKHWMDDPAALRRDGAQVLPAGGDLQAFVRGAIEEHAPDAVIVGGYGGPEYDAVLAARERSRFALGFWLEQPTPRNLAVAAVKRRMVRERLAPGGFVLAIGDRAERYYQGLVPEVALVPYGQVLDPCLAIERPRAGDGIRFLFSGQLVPRHNVPLMMAAASRLIDERGPSFKFTIAAHGPEQVAIDAALARDPRLKSVLEYDRDYTSWTDRLRPFAQSDVLVYPSAHSGWGLVIPEAMAAGLAVITTRNVEAARWFVRHRVSGIFVEPNVAELAREMARCLDDPAEVAAIGRAARADAAAGQASAVAERFERAMTRVLRRASA